MMLMAIAILIITMFLMNIAMNILTKISIDDGDDNDVDNGDDGKFYAFLKL